jgi:hypothetical protein
MNSDIKIGVLCPHRGDKPQFLAQFKKYMANQIMQPNVLHFVDYEPESKDIDVTQRYRRGCEHLFRISNCDVVLFMEFDDFYNKNYIAQMILEWKRAGRPAIFGIGHTIYYHIFQQMWVNIPHRSRASAMSTLVTRVVLNMSWPKDNNPYLDADMWAKIPGKTFIPRSPICIGIKHGIGLVGGGAHNGDNAHYNMKDAGGTWLKAIIGEENYKFYEQLQKEAQEV